MIIKNILYIALLLFAVSCDNNTKQERKKEVLLETAINNEDGNQSIPIIAERIDGPANIRSRPNGEVIFTLDDKIIGLALNDYSFSDFEDGLQYFTATENYQDIIITRNLKDFKASKLPVMTARQFIESMRKV